MHLYTGGKKHFYEFISTRFDRLCQEYAAIIYAYIFTSGNVSSLLFAAFLL